MVSIEAELCVESGKSDLHGRRIRGAAEWAMILKDYDRSGLTQSAFCHREGLSYGTLVAWLGRRRKHGGDLIASVPSKSKFHELSLDGGVPEGLSLSLEVSLPDGTLVRGKQASELAQLVQLLRS
jgi:hypothetical protein